MENLQLLGHRANGCSLPFASRFLLIILMLNLDVVGGMPDTLRTKTTVTIIVGGAVMGATVAAVLQSHTVVCAFNSLKAK